MDLSKVITISGKRGLFRLLSETRSGMVVQSFEDGRKLPVFATDRSSTLEDISIFTHDKEVPLKDVLWKIFEKNDGKPGPDPKSPPEELKNAFQEYLPDYDKDRVHVSDMKKVFAWYNILLDQEMITKPEESEEKDDDAGKRGQDDTPGEGGEKEKNPGK